MSRISLQRKITPSGRLWELMEKAQLEKAAQVSQEIIEQKIFIIRGHKVMLSNHLVELYKVEVRSLVQAVKRNIERHDEEIVTIFGAIRQLMAPKATATKRKIGF